MKHPVMLPQLTETMEEGTIMSWRKKPGERVAKREILFEVETDKMTMEVEAVDAGVLCEILVEEDGVATVGQQVATIADSEDEC
mgnify:CR=1 FL=1